MTDNDFEIEKTNNSSRVYTNYRKGTFYLQPAPANPKLDLNILNSDSQFKLVLELL